MTKADTWPRAHGTLAQGAGLIFRTLCRLREGRRSPLAVTVAPGELPATAENYDGNVVFCVVGRRDGGR